MDNTDLLINSAKQGDKNALVKLIMDKKTEYYKLAFTYLKNKDDALDALEDMIVILYENIHKLKKNEAFYSWSKTILVNCCKNLLSKNKKIVSLDSIEEKPYNEDFEGSHDRVYLDDHLSKLNKKHQEVLKLRYFLDLDYQTISEITKTPLGTVKSRISIALKKLKESMEVN